MNRLFDEFSRGFDLPTLSSAGNFNWPSVEVSETDKLIKVDAELPGMEEKDVEVLLNDDVLTIRGEKRSESEDQERQWSERYYGSFERRIPLDAEVDADKITATFKNGVLKIEIPKSEQAQEKAKRIQITH